MLPQNALTDVLAAESPSHSCASISLEFGSLVPASIRCRMMYSFRVFAAVYGHPVERENCSATIRVLYGGSRFDSGSRDQILIPALYSSSGCDTGNEFCQARFEYAGESIPLFLGVDPSTGSPDWLGEIFLWLSGELESCPKKHDSVGRIPYSETPFAKNGLSPRKPFAALLMAWFENILRKNEEPALPKAPSPIPGSEHVVLPSHDIDFHFCGRKSALVRTAKNLLIALSLYKSSSFFFENLRMLFGTLAGKRPGEYIPPLLEAVQSRGSQSTFFSVARRGHRRDPDYSLETIAPYIADAFARGFSVGLHGSYRSVTEDRTLAAEAAVLAEQFGIRPLSNRQHWLRFENHRTLFREAENAGMLLDSSLGFPESVGFRNGANFAFPPYDFDFEHPHRFLEIPLAIMDGGLEAESRATGQNPQQIADELLRESRKTSWGGISILWHNPVEPLSVPRKINDVFWRCAEAREAARESWMTFDQFLGAVIPRYQQAGLLEGIGSHA